MTKLRTLRDRLLAAASDCVRAVWHSLDASLTCLVNMDWIIDNIETWMRAEIQRELNGDWSKGTYE